jgi:acyl-coenzyme A synthetase/AMP-(fatty) acid ligase
MAGTPDITSYGKRLFPHIIDARAKSGYERPYALYPRTKDPADGFQEISYARFANAVNRAAWWLDENLRETGEKENAFAYFGPSDLRYAIFVLATMKTGRKVFYFFFLYFFSCFFDAGAESVGSQILIASLRNTVEAQLSLFEKVGCKSLVSCSSLTQGLRPLFTSSGNIRKVQAPDLDEILAEDKVRHYIYEKTFEQEASRTFIHLHTSGSSGNPKPINWNYKWFCGIDHEHFIPTNQGTYLTSSFLNHQNLLVLLPCFHVST